MKSAKTNMINKYGSRECYDLKSIFNDFSNFSLPYDYFYKYWIEVASVLNYPDARQMRKSDDVLEVIKLNNTNIFYSQFEDAYEVLQSIDCLQTPHETSFEEAIDMKVELNSIEDMISFLCNRKNA